MKRFNVLQSLAVLFVLSLTVWGLVPSVAEGAVPQLVNFQGILKDGSGNPVPNASYSVTFTIYDAPTGGNVKWTETQSVTTANGLFTVLLGSTTPVPDSVFYDSSRYLGMAVSPDGEMTPRQRLSSVGYSYVSSQWTSAGQNLFTLSGKVGIGESNPLNTLTIGSNGGFTSTGLFPGILMGTTSFQTKQLIIGRDENNFVQLAYADGDPVSAARLLVEGNHPLSISTGGSLYLNTGGNNSIFVSTSGDVGIGTQSPQMLLHVRRTPSHSAAVRFTDENDHDTEVGRFGSGWNGLTNPFIIQHLAGSGVNDMVFTPVTNGPASGIVIKGSTGNVGIGTTAPSEKLHVVGNICATGTIGACSDARFKQSVHPIEGSLDKVEKLQGVSYQWNREEYPQFAGGNQIGFLAQEVKQVLPEVVSEGSDGTLSVDYGRFSVVLLEAIKEQQKEIKELKAAIEKLQVERR